MSSEPTRTVAELEEALRECRAQLQALVQAMPDAIFRVAGDGTLLDLHFADPVFVGAPARDVVGQTIEELTGPRFGSEWMAKLNVARSSGAMQVWNCSTAPDDASPRHFEARIVPFGDSETLTILRDVSERVKQERLLRDSEQRYRALFEYAANPIVVYGVDGRIASCNPACVRLTGYNVEELLDTAIGHLLAPERSGEDVRKAFSRVLAGDRVTLDTVIHRRDGHRVYVHAVAAPVYAGDRIVGVMASLLDTTEQRRAVLALAESESRFRLVQSATNDVICDWHYPSKSAYFSSNMLEVFGHPGGQRSDAFTWWMACVHPDDYHNAGRAYDAAISAGQSRYFTEYRLRRGDGSWANVVETGVIASRDGPNPLRIISSLSDVTERRQAQAALTLSEERFRLVQQATNNVIWEWRALEDVADFSENLEDVLGYPGGTRHCAFEWWRAIVHPDDLERVIETQRAVIGRGEAAYRVEYRMRRSKGAYATVLETGFLQTEPDGTITRIVGSYHDVTPERETQIALATSEERFRLVQMATRDVITDWDPASDTIWLSDNAADVLGHHGGVYQNAWEWWWGLVHPEDAPRTKEDATRCMARRDPSCTLEFRVRREDGSWVHVVNTAAVVYGDNGAPARVIGTFRDVSEQVQSRTALAASEERFRLVQEATRNVVWELSLPAGDGYVSENIRDVLGYEGGFIPSMQHWWRERAHPEDAPRVTDCLTTAVASGEPGFHCTYRVRRADGSWATVEEHGCIERDARGEPLRVVGTFADVSEQESHQAWLRALAVTGEVIAAESDSAQLVSSVIRAAIAEIADYVVVSERDPSGLHTPTYIAHPDPERAALMAEVRDLATTDPMAMRGPRYVMESGRPYLGPRLPVPPDEPQPWGPELDALTQKLRFSSFMVVPLRGRGQVQGLVTLVNAESGRVYMPSDMPMAERLAERIGLAMETARLYDELRRSDRAKDTFLAMLGHELRNPLAGIRNSAELLRLQANEAPQILPALDALDRQSRVMSRLVDDLLDISRITRGKIELQRAAVDLRVCVRDAIASARPLADVKSISIQAQEPEEGVLVDGDAVRLTQVVANLLNNAVKFSPKGGVVEMTLQRAEGTAVLRVRDEGSGIPADVLPTVFDLFVQGDNAHARAGGGLGIGLTLARELVELHGGKITAESEGAGRGSTFTVTLPSVASPPDARPHLIAVMEPAGPRTPDLLLVDDNVDAADTLKVLLTAYGYSVRSAPDGESALRAAAERPPDVLLLDIGLPDVDGYEVAERLRASGWDGLIFAMTGFDQESDYERSHSAGFERHLVKPVDVGVLLAELDGLTGRLP